jgi:hypothetical protein
VNFLFTLTTKFSTSLSMQFTCNQPSCTPPRSAISYETGRRYQRITECPKVGQPGWSHGICMLVASTGIGNFTLQILLELVASIQPQGVQVWTVKQYQKPRVTV